MGEKKFLENEREEKKREVDEKSTNFDNMNLPIIFLISSDFLSYHPPLSNHCLNNSMGGCAPNSSLDGILTSSTNMENSLPADGP